MAHKFNPLDMKKLDERKKILPPGEVLMELGLRPGDIMVDVGAGSGYFSLPASEIVGEKGKVIAVDSSREMIQELKSRLEASGIRNIEVRLSQEYDLLVDENIADFAFLCTVLHEVDDKILFLKGIWKIMKPLGRLAIVEWVKKPMEKGPPLHDRMERSETAGLLHQLQFKNTQLKNYNDYFYFVSAVK